MIVIYNLDLGTIDRTINELYECDNVKENFGCIVTDNEKITVANSRVKVLDGIIVPKPEIEFTVNKQQIDLAVDPNLQVDIELINNCFECDKDSIVEIIVEDVKIPIQLQGVTASQTIEFSEKGNYKIFIDDHRFKRVPAKEIEVV